jgi:hypothetical protein
LDDLLSQRANILHEDAHKSEELERVKNTPFEDLTKDDKITAMYALLQQMQPYFSANNLAVVGNYHASHQQSASYQQSILDSVKFARSVQMAHQSSKMADAAIQEQEGRVATTEGEELAEEPRAPETLTGMLDNIKV